MSELPYQGLRILDVSQGIAGPYCAGLLCQQGAEVIKVEPPEGDWIRRTGGGRDGMTPLAITGNTGKRSVCIDATQPRGRDLILALARSADVFVQNNRPGVMERLGLDYDALTATNRRLVYVSITGFGPDGPDARKPGTDSVLQSVTGIAYANRNADGTPRRVPLLIPDTATAMYAAQAVGAALFARERSGVGRHLQISLLQACAAFQAAPIIEQHLFAGSAPPPLTVPSGVFRTRDGWLTVVAVTEDQFVAALRCTGLEDWVTDPRFATLKPRQSNAQLINDAIAERLAQRDSAYWIERFAAADVLFAPIADYAAFRDMPQARHLGVFADLDQPPYGSVPLARVPGSTPQWPTRPAPASGEHTRAILDELGIPAAEIARLHADGIVRSAD